MKRVIEFLLYPHSTGLHVITYKLKLCKMAEFFDYVFQKIRSRTWRGSSGFKIIDDLLNKEEKDQEFFLSDRLSTALADIILKECKSEFCEYFKFSPEDLDIILLEPRDPERAFQPSPNMRVRRLVRGFFRSRIYPKYHDFLYINYKISKNNRNMMIELVSLQNKGLELFNNLISCLPVLNDSMEKISSKISHSEKYIFKTYAMAVQHWVDKEDRFLLNENLRNFIKASIRYYLTNEWRTSVVLSAITVESIYAELYEESYKKNAPDIPLEGLISKVEKKIKMPDELIKKIDELNKARIASVHRSENPVSDKDAIISMMGVTALVM